MLTINKDNIGKMPFKRSPDGILGDKATAYQGKEDLYGSAFKLAYQELDINQVPRGLLKKQIQAYVAASYDEEDRLVYEVFFFRELCRLVEEGRINIDVSTQISIICKDQTFAIAKSSALDPTSGNHDLYKILMKLRGIENLKANIQKQQEKFNKNPDEIIHGAGSGAASTLSAEVVNEAYTEALKYIEDNPQELLGLENNSKDIVLPSGRVLNFTALPGGKFALILETGDLRADGTRRSLERLHGSKNTFTPAFRLDDGLEMYACREAKLDENSFAAEKEQIAKLRHVDGVLQEYFAPHGSGQTTRKLFSPLVPDSLDEMLGKEVPGLDTAKWELNIGTKQAVVVVAAYNIEIVEQLLNAFKGLHGESIEHGDFKPEHVLIGRDPATNKLHVYLMDFDRHRNFGDSLKLDGSPAYYSPEMLQLEYGGMTVEAAKAKLQERAEGDQNKVDAILNSYAWHLLTKDLKSREKIPVLSGDSKKINGSSDVFSLGLTIFQIVTGEVLDGTEKDQKTFKRIDKFCRSGEFLAGMLAVDPEQRVDIATAAVMFAKIKRTAKIVLNNSSQNSKKAAATNDKNEKNQDENMELADLNKTMGMVDSFINDNIVSDTKPKFADIIYALQIDAELQIKMLKDYVSISNEVTNTVKLSAIFKYYGSILKESSAIATFNEELHDETTWIVEQKKLLAAKLMQYVIIKKQNAFDKNKHSTAGLRTLQVIWGTSTRKLETLNDCKLTIKRLVAGIKDAAKYEKLFGQPSTVSHGHSKSAALKA